jgi:hypothetical protein
LDPPYTPSTLVAFKRCRRPSRTAQRGSGIGREERIAGAGGEDHDPAFLEMAQRATADIGLGDLIMQRGLDPRFDAGTPQRPAASAFINVASIPI